MRNKRPNFLGQRNPHVTTLGFRKISVASGDGNPINLGGNLQIPHFKTMELLLAWDPQFTSIYFHIWGQKPSLVPFFIFTSNTFMGRFVVWVSHKRQVNLIWVCLKMGYPEFQQISADWDFSMATNIATKRLHWFPLIPPFLDKPTSQLAL